MLSIALASMLAATVAAFLVVLDRRDARTHAERAELLQRIQAPALAVAEHAARTVPGYDADGELIPPPEYDDDEAYWAARGEPMPHVIGRPGGDE